VMNHLSRDVSVLDLEDVRARREVARVAVVGETLPPVLLRGQVLFNLAADPRISHLGWISCASCHPDGGTDNTTWATPEGLRQTTPLWRLDGTAPFHASATRDEVQDFEVEIEGFMGGSGLAPALAAPMLGAPNGGRSFDLDALAAYVLTGIRVPDAALGDAAQVAAGREVFAAVGCAGCHGGPAWTRSALPGPVGTLAPNGEEEVLAVLRDVGTFAPGAVGLGANGFDVPTLLGLHATAPYLHDGSAGRLGDVLANPRHAPASLSAAERVALAAFLATIDGNTPPFD
jgi:mono/diheme cytochrome c family protein